MQALIDSGIMKQFMEGGVIMCSYRQIEVGKEDGREEEVEIKRDRFLF